MQLLGTFYGFEQRKGVHGLFKIYVTDQGLFGGWIAPRAPQGTPSRSKGNGAGDRAAMQRNAQDWEKHYDSLVPGSDELLAAHADNFAFASSITQASLTWKLKPLERAATRFGALDVRLGGGKKRRFYLVGRPAPEEVAGMLQAALPQLELEGKPIYCA